MLQITSRLRKYAIARWKLKASISEVRLRRVIGQKLFNGYLSQTDIDEINAGKKTADGKPGKKTGTTTKPKPKPKPKPKGKPGVKNRCGTGTPPGLSAADVSRAARKEARKLLKRLGISGRPGDDVNPAEAFGKAARARVKDAAEEYETSRKGAVYPTYRNVGGEQLKHPWANQPARIADHPLSHPSDRDKAVSLAFLRFQMARTPAGKSGELPQWARMTKHDRELVLYAAHHEKWTGIINHADGRSKLHRRRLSEFHIKTLLDDSVSGGIEITPVVFDDALILTPVLYGELFPFVNVVNTAKGRRVKGGQAINPDFTWGTAEGTAITPFNTASFVTAFDTPIYPCTAAIELGQDFEEDSPVDLGGQVVEQFGLKALETLDYVIANGNGYNQPQGFFNAPGATLVGSTFGVNGPFTVSDFEGLMFNVPKQFRGEAGAYLAFVMNDYTYRKAVSIPVGPADERRVFGMDHQDYKLLKADCKIQNSIPDGYAAYINLRRYRMYRRLGMQVRIETGGRQLALSNTRLVVIRMRYGGQLEIGGAAALMKDGQTV